MQDLSYTLYLVDSPSLSHRSATPCIQTPVRYAVIIGSCVELSSCSSVFVEKSGSQGLLSILSYPIAYQEQELLCSKLSIPGSHPTTQFRALLTF